jgi:hypothetical protein
LNSVIFSSTGIFFARHHLSAGLHSNKVGPDKQGHDHMSNLRFFGLFIGMLGLIATFFFYRGAKWRRSNFLLLSLFNLCLISVSINPASVNFVRDLLALENYQYGRIIALLILSTIALFFHALYTKAKVERLRSQFDVLVRNLGVEQANRERAFRESSCPVTILIPAFNEADNLADLLPKIPQKLDHLEIGVLVVDDGSTDKTGKVVRDLGYSVVSNFTNRGGGAALRLGYDLLANTQTQFCVTMDADGQHDPKDIHRLLAPLIQGESDFVIGSRILGKSLQGDRLRKMGVRFFGMMISVLLGEKITDPSSGFRAFRMKSVSSIQLREDQYHTSELIIGAIKTGMKIAEVPITIYKRVYGKSKKGKDWAYGLNFMRAVLAAWWR